MHGRQLRAYYTGTDGGENESASKIWRDFFGAKLKNKIFQPTNSCGISKSVVCRNHVPIEEVRS